MIQHQKRGLPHIHITFQMNSKEVKNAGTINAIVTANLPTGVCPNHPHSAPRARCGNKEPAYCCKNAMWENVMVQKCTRTCKLGRDGNKYFHKQPCFETFVDDRGCDAQA